MQIEHRLFNIFNYASETRLEQLIIKIGSSSHQVSRCITCGPHNVSLVENLSLTLDRIGDLENFYISIGMTLLNRRDEINNVEFNELGHYNMIFCRCISNIDCIIFKKPCPRKNQREFMTLTNNCDGILLLGKSFFRADLLHMFQDKVWHVMSEQG